MNKIFYYVLGGAGAFILAAALIKKKPGLSLTSQQGLPSPRRYMTAAGDNWIWIAKRFGISPVNKLVALNNSTGKGLQEKVKIPGTVILLPGGIADTGATNFAKGTVQ